MHYFNCTSCKLPSRAGRRDAKRCAHCSTLKVLEFLRKRYGTKKCRSCSAAFKPAIQKDLSYCGACETRQQIDKLVQIPDVACSYCDGPVYSNSPLEDTCLRCLKDPDIQAALVEKLVARQNSATVPQPPKPTAPPEPSTPAPPAVDEHGFPVKLPYLPDNSAKELGFLRNRAGNALSKLRRTHGEGSAKADALANAFVHVPVYLAALEAATPRSDRVTVATTPTEGMTR